MFELPNIECNKKQFKPKTIGLADELKLRTAKLHKLAERTGIVADLLNRSASMSDYILYIRNLISIYQSLEKPFVHLANAETLTPFFDNRIKRSDHLISDLDNMVSRDVWTKLPLMKGTTIYKAHIDHMANTTPQALIGHLYVRYLGDLNGGQLLQHVLIESFNFDKRSLSFYNYPEIKDLKLYRLQYRDKFNSLSINSTERKQIINTAIKAFEFNIHISKEIKLQRKLDYAVHKII